MLSCKYLARQIDHLSLEMAHGAQGYPKCTRMEDNSEAGKTALHHPSKFFPYPVVLLSFYQSFCCHTRADRL